MPPAPVFLTSGSTYAYPSVAMSSWLYFRYE